MDDDEVGALTSLWTYGPLLVGSGAVAPFERLAARRFVRCTRCDVSTRMPCYEAEPLAVIQALARSALAPPPATKEE